MCPLQEFPANVENWNELTNEQKYDLLFNDEWLDNIDKSHLWYHYTDMSALLSMLQNKSVELWATHSQYMNDRNEIKIGVDRICDLLGDKISAEALHKRYEDSTFISCFSCAKDCVPMWNAYGHGGDGVSLGFIPHKPDLNKMSYVKVIYNETESLNEWYNKVAKQINNKDYFSNICSKINLLFFPIALKSNFFEYEQEIRIVCSESIPVEFRNCNGILTPYKKITIDSKYLQEIIIGPAADQERNIRTIQMLLQKLQLNHVQVTPSIAPLRK